MAVNNVVNFQNLREQKDKFSTLFQRKLQVSKDFIKRLGLEAELSGHTGCVNCLQWNEAGNLLASGSDDLNIILWTPFLSKKSNTIQSGHHGNIFSVKFLPGTNDHCIVSCAADFKMLVNDYTRGEIIYRCHCHHGRVKRLATNSYLPYMFWSASEDGQVLQSDIRCPHSCTTMGNENVLVNLTNHTGHSAEAKCIAINPVNPDLIAVGANDPYVRMYDRRMIKLTTSQFGNIHPIEDGSDNLPPGCVSYFIAGHLPLKQHDFQRRFRTLTSTYVTFSPDGKDLLTNLGGEQIYLFNILSKRKKLVFNMSEKALSHYKVSDTKNEDLKMECCGESSSKSDSDDLATDGVNQHSSHCLHNSSNSPTASSQETLVEKCVEQLLPPEVDSLKISANREFEKKNFTLCISYYSSAIVSCLEATCLNANRAVACLYANRAAAYIKRTWYGDCYAAIRDCLTALELDPFHLKSHFRLVQCLHTLKWDTEAYDSLQAFKIKFPHDTKTKSFEDLENDVKTAFFNQKAQSSKTSSSFSFGQLILPNAESSQPNSTLNVDNLTYPEAGEAIILSDSNDSSDEDDASSLNPDGRRIFDVQNFRLSSIGLSAKEKAWRASAYDYEYRYCGHCNTTTDIKEANFFGNYGEYIIAGSDDASMFFWDRVTSNIVRVIRADESIVNCLQPHPSSCMLATSGIDPVVRLWSPRPEDGSSDDREILDLDDAAFANQRRMDTDPLEVMLRNMGYRVPNVTDEGDDGPPFDPTLLCRTS